MILSTDGHRDKVKPVYPPFNFAEAGGIINDVNQVNYYYDIPGAPFTNLD